MRKFFAIPLALLIILSGMHFTIATHYCGGKIAATKISLSGKEASCGMVSGHESENAGETQVSRQCCDNEFSVYKTDKDYSPSAFHFIDISRHINHEFCIPEGYSFHSTNALLPHQTNVSPPDRYPANAVSLAGICIFRI
jgi:hypothetical protein